MSQEVEFSALRADEDNGETYAAIEHERKQVAEFVKGLSLDEIKSGEWFAKLLSFSLGVYTSKVDWKYFQEKYEGLPADAIVDQRIRMASRYAAIEGGLSAGAYTGAVATTIGSLGGASPIAVPAALGTMMVDVVFVTQLQLRLAYDIAVLYRMPLDLDDPDDLWKLIRVAFVIKGGEVAREGVIKAAPLAVRPLLKRFYSKGVLSAAKSLPVVGKLLLQRNVIKIGIPLVGVPLAVVLNRSTTLVAGRHAKAIFRNEAQIIELAGKLARNTRQPKAMLWIAWLVIQVDGPTREDEALLFKHLVARVEELHQIVDTELSEVVDLDIDEVWSRLSPDVDDLSDVIHLARRVAAVDGEPNKKERALISEIEKRCGASS